MNTKTVLACTAVMCICINCSSISNFRRCISKKSCQNKVLNNINPSNQNSLSVGGGGNFLSGNNVNFQNQQNFGHNVLGQSDSD